MAEQNPDNQKQPTTPQQSADNTQANTDDAVQDALADAQSSLDEIKGAVDDFSEPQDMNDGVIPQSDDQPPSTSIDLLGDVDLNVTIELGRTEMLVEDVLRLGQGSVVELDKLAGDPVDVHVNGRLVARGEVLVLNDNFCIRISEIVANLEEEAEAAAEEERNKQVTQEQQQ